MDIGAFTIATEGFINYTSADSPPVELEIAGHDIELLFVEDT
jgi:hypothetical protein